MRGDDTTTTVRAPPHLLVTGANGYIGEHLVASALAKGWRVTALSRRPMTNPAVGFIAYDLDHGPTAALPSDATALVHLAADTIGRSVGEAAEIAAAGRLADLADAAGIRFVFVSSQAAHPNAPTRYGRVKWAIEQRVKTQGGVIIRPGLVYGGLARSGLYAALLALVRRSPCLPALIPSPRVQPIHVRDLCEALLRLAAGVASARSEFQVGAEEPIAFTSFLRALAQDRLRVRRVFVPVPARLATGVAMASSRLFPGLAPLAERLVSLQHLRSMATAEGNALLGVPLRPLRDGLHPSGSARRRDVISEGRALLAYVLGSRPRRGLIARYVRAIEALEGGAPYPLPSAVRRWPSLLRFLDANGVVMRHAGDPRFERRLDIAWALAEASPAAAERFILRTPIHRARVAVTVVALLAIEVCAQLIRAAVAPVTCRHLPAGGRSRSTK